MTAFAPDLETATELCARGQTVLLTATRVDDLETPVSAYLKLASHNTNTFLLESVEGGAFRGGTPPSGLIRTSSGVAGAMWPRSPPRPPQALRRRIRAQRRQALQSLRTLIDESRLTLPSGLPPIAAGLFGYLGYDTIRQVERLPNHAGPDPLDLPEGQLLRPRVMVVFDALRQEILVAAPVRPKPGMEAELQVDAARRRIEAVFARLDAPAPIAGSAAPWTLEEPVSNMEPAQYHQNVETAKDYIRAGDIFQVVPSQRFSAPYTATPLSLYRSLRRTNPRLSSTSSTCPASPLSARARKSWCGCAATPSPSAPLQARVHAAIRKKPIRPMRPICAPIPRNAPST